MRFAAHWSELFSLILDSERWRGGLVHDVCTALALRVSHGEGLGSGGLLGFRAKGLGGFIAYFRRNCGVCDFNDACMLLVFW